MTDMNLSELSNILNEFGIKSSDDLRARLSDDFRSSAAFHDGHQKGFKYAHTLQSTFEMCLQTQTKIQDFDSRFYETMKLLRSVEKRLKKGG